MEYRPIGTENNECRKSTIPSRFTCGRATRSKPGNGSTLEARWDRKGCTPRPDRFSVGSGPLSSLLTWNRSDSALMRFLGGQPFPITSPNDQGGLGGSGLTMVVVGEASVGRQRHRLPQFLCLCG